MKKLLAVMCFVMNSLCSIAQPNVNEQDPHRGMYIDKFLNFNTNSINNGAAFVDSSNSILSVDVNHDGIYEKEDRLLSYCRDNHITSIVLYDLRNIIGKGYTAWDPISSRYVDLEEHLCRFINKARRSYCITEIGAAGQTRGFFNRISTMYSAATPPIHFSPAETIRVMSNSILALAANDTLMPGDSLFELSEDVKYWLRLARFSSHDCQAHINIFHEEYEFWNVNNGELPANVEVNPNCINECCTNGAKHYSDLGNCQTCPVVTTGNVGYPTAVQYAYDAVFMRAIKTMKLVKQFLNQNLTPNDANFIRTQAYFSNPDHGFTSPINDLYAFMDGIPTLPLGPNWNNCQDIIFDTNSDGVLQASELDGDPYLNRIINTEYGNFPTPQKYSINTYSKLSFNNYFPNVAHTDIHQLLNAESVSNNGYADYWGPYFHQTPTHNIFTAEKMDFDLFVQDSRAHGISITPGGSFYDILNDIHPGGVHWYTSSMMAPINDIQTQLGHPKIFNIDNPICGATSPLNLTVQYLGPTESDLQVDFWITDCLNNDIPGASCSAVNPFTQQTAGTADYYNNFGAANFFINDFSVSTPTPPVSCDHIIGHMLVHYPGGCSYSYQEDIHFSSGALIAAVGRTVVCQGEPVYLRANSGASANTYQWFRIPPNSTIGIALTQNPVVGDAGREILVVESGNYYCVIAGSNCVGTSNSINVTINPNPFVSITTDCSSTDPNRIFTANYSNSGGSIGGETYLWSTGETTSQITLNTVTFANYRLSVTVTSSQGCQRNDMKIIRNLNPIGNLVVTTHDATTLCASDGSADVFYTGDANDAPFRVVLFDGTNFLPVANWTLGTAGTISNLRPGNYTVFLTSSFSLCQTSISFSISTVLGGGTPPVITETHVNSLCANQGRGSIHISQITGDPGATFTVQIPSLGFSQLFSSSMDIVGLIPGQYSLLVTDGNCNSSITNVTIGLTSVNPLSVSISSVTPVSCFGDNNGAATALAAGGTGPYGYAWMNTSVTIQSITNQIAGSYQVVVTDANSCTATTFAEISTPEIFTYSIIDNYFDCQSSSSVVSIFVDGGTPFATANHYHGFSNSWVEGNNFVFTNTTLSGTQNFTIQDQNNCLLPINITPVSSNGLTLTTHQTNITCLVNLGSADVSVLGGHGIYSYQWSNGMSVSSISNLLAGNYTCTVTDASGCTATAMVTITSSGGLTTQTQSTNPTCNGSNNGTANITVTSGPGNFNYSWQPGNLATSAIQNLQAGNYSCTVTDQNGCTGTGTVTITDPASLSATILPYAPIGCNGGTTNITLNPTGGTSPYTVTSSPISVPIANYTYTLPVGNYTYTVTDANGCAASVNVNITGPTAALSANIQSSTNVTCNNGTNGSATVSASNGTPTYSYSWTPSGGINATAQNLSAGTYVCTVTDANGCTTSTSIIITQPAQMSLAISNPNGLCYNTPICATAGYYQYLWTPSNSNSRCINVQTAAIYTVTATNSAGCTASSTINLSGLSQSCCGTYQLITQTTFNNNFVLTGQSYSLNSNIVLTHNVTLNSCTIEIGPGFSIDAAGYTLTLNGSTLYACTQMWRGIIASQFNGGVVATNSNINDAQFGIQGNHGTTIKIDGCAFTDDYVGVFFSGNGSNGVASINGTVVNSEFSSTQLKPGFPGQFPMPLSKSLAGIMIDNNSLINIGIGANQDNVFEDMNLGIYSTNSSLNIDHSIFRQIINYNTYSLPWGQPLGTAILCTGTSNNSLNLNGHNSNLLDFEDCIRGVRSWGMSAICQFNSVWNCDWGIDVSYQYNCKSYIHDNTLSCNYYGIVALLNDYASTFAIYDNNIEVGSRFSIDGNYPYSIAVLLSDGGTKNFSRLVKNNQITLNEFARHGVYGNGIYGYTIDHNYVHFNDVINNQSGISLVKSELCKVNCNSVSGYGSSFTNDKQSAMWFQDSPENVISCNTVTGTYTGIGFMGTCVGGAGNNIQSNDIGEHSVGMYYKGTSTRVDHQDFKGNSWYFDNYSIYGAWDENLFWAPFDKYKVFRNGPRFPTGQSLTNHPTPDNDPAISEVWPLDFILDLGTSDENCGNNLFPNQLNCAVEIGGGDGGSDKRAARNLEGSQDYDEETKWKTRERLYEKLLNEPNYLDSDTVYVNFFQQMAGTYLEQIASLNKEKDELFVNQQSLLQSMEVRSEQINFNSALIRSCDSLIQPNNLPTFTLDSIKIARYSIIQNTSLLLNQNNASLSLLQTAIENKADIMNADNAQINSTKIYEQNEKLVNEVYLQVVYKNKFENLSNYVSQIVSIATQCPLSGGPSVYMARTLASLIDPQLRYDDEQACAQTGYSWRLSQKNSELPFSIFPNPANDKVYVHYSVESAAKLAIYSEIGELILLKNVPKDGKSLEIDLSLFKNGVYSCKLIQENQIDVKQLIIIH